MPNQFLSPSASIVCPLLLRDTLTNLATCDLYPYTNTLTYVCQVSHYIHYIRTCSSKNILLERVWHIHCTLQVMQLTNFRTSILVGVKRGYHFTHATLLLRPNTIFFFNLTKQKQFGSTEFLIFLALVLEVRRQMYIAQGIQQNYHKEQRR